MEKKGGIYLKRRFIFLTAGMMFWFSVSSAIYALATGGWGWGILELLFSAAVIVIITNRNLLNTIETRSVPIALVITLLLVFLMQGYTEVLDVINLNVRMLGETQLIRVVKMVSSIVFLVLLVPFVVEFFRLLRERT